MNRSNTFSENSLSFVGKASKASKTPTVEKVRNTPSRKTPSRYQVSGPKVYPSPRTPGGGDRFIPDRTNMNFELSHYLVNNANSQENANDSSKSNVLTELVGDLANFRIMAYSNKAPLAPEGHMNDLKVLYSSCKSTTTKKSPRYIPTQPESVLDAPDIQNDYYLKLIDWSAKNLLAVALKNDVYLWNAENGSIDKLCTLDGQDYVASVTWDQDGSHLAVGTSEGKVQIWDVTNQKRLRSLNNSAFRISCSDWNFYLLSAGSRDGHIYNHDVRISTSLVANLEGHTQEICGIKWSPNGRMLATGGNDNTVNIWSNQFMTDRANAGAPSPLHRFTDHQAAIKALAWCPWRPNVLASGGGTADRHIRIWNCENGNNLYSFDTKSQVSGILWSDEYKELISSHGYSKNELIIWKYPSLDKLAELTGHTARILSLSMSPDGSTVVSLGADETLRFWECFKVDQKRKKSKALKESKTESTALKFDIR